MSADHRGRSSMSRAWMVVQDWIDAGGLPEGIELYAVTTSIDENAPDYPPNAWLVDEGWTPTTVIDDASSSLADAFGLASFPFWVFVDGDGTIDGRWAGEVAPEQPDQIVVGLLRD